MASKAARPLAGALLGLLLAAFVWLAQDAGTALVVAVPLQSPDAILVLASHEWERLPAAVQLAADNPRSRVLLTMPPVVTKYNCHDCANRPARLVAAGIVADRIEVLPIPPAVGGTRGEAMAARTWASKAGAKRLVVVTSPYHARRSLATFAAVMAGTRVQLGLVPATASSPARPARWWATAYDRAYVRYEWAGLVYYWLRYGIHPNPTHDS